MRVLDTVKTVEASETPAPTLTATNTSTSEATHTATATTTNIMIKEIIILAPTPNATSMPDEEEIIQTTEDSLTIAPTQMSTAKTTEVMPTIEYTNSLTEILVPITDFAKFRWLLCANQNTHTSVPFKTNTQCYIYGDLYRLTAVTGVDGSSFVYNGLGDRYQQIVNGATITYPLDLAAGLVNVLADSDYTYLYGNSVVAQISDTQTGYYL